MKRLIIAVIAMALIENSNAESQLDPLVNILLDNGVIDFEQKQELLKSDSNIKTLIDILNTNGSISEQQLHSLNLLKQPLPYSTNNKIGGDFHIKTQNGGVTISSYDGASSFRMGGRVMLDSAHYSLDDIGDGSEIRRLRLEVDGQYFYNWNYALSVDFAGNDSKLKNAYLVYRGERPYQLQFGQFKQPFGLENQTSSKYLTFTERALPDALVPQRGFGIGLSTKTKHWRAAAGLFGENVSKQADDDTDQGLSLTARVNYAPWHSKHRVLHLGIGASYRSVRKGDVLRYQQGSETHISDTEFLDTGKNTIDSANHIIAAGAEIAVVKGPFSLQGEWIRNSINQKNGLSDLEFKGGYLYGSWFITGESRHYKFKKGAFGRVRPRSSSGAFELAVRYSELNLQHQDVDGGKQHNTSIGLNWYINSHIRLMNNYILVDTQNDKFTIFQLRLQADF